MTPPPGQPQQPWRPGVRESTGCRSTPHSDPDGRSHPASDLPIRVRRVIARTALDLWGTATGRPIPYPARPVHTEESV